MKNILPLFSSENPKSDGIITGPQIRDLMKNKNFMGTPHKPVSGPFQGPSSATTPAYIRPFRGPQPGRPTQQATPTESAS
jgi:hypothetical protein